MSKSYCEEALGMPKIKVLTTGRLAKPFYEHFKDSKLALDIQVSEDLTQAQIDWADCLASFPIDANVSLHGLKWIHCFGAGVDGFIKRSDLGAALRLSRTTGRLGAKAGEFCLCHVLNFFQDTFSIYEDMRTQDWQERQATSITQQTVLLLGTGTMAQGIAKLLRAAGLKVIGVNTSGRTSDSNFERCFRLDALADPLIGVSCVINTLPLSAATHNLVDARFFARLQKALFINVGRGATVQTQDLALALETGQVRYCVLDVFDQEPLPKSSWLWQHPQVFISPHQAAITDINDVINSFIAAFEAYTSNTVNQYFVDKEKSY